MQSKSLTDIKYRYKILTDNDKKHEQNALEKFEESSDDEMLHFQKRMNEVGGEKKFDQKKNYFNETIYHFKDEADMCRFMINEENSANCKLKKTCVKKKKNTSYYTFLEKNYYTYKITKTEDEYIVYKIDNVEFPINSEKIESKRSSSFLLRLIQIERNKNPVSVCRKIHEDIGISSTDVKDIHFIKSKNIKRNLKRFDLKTTVHLDDNEYDSLFKYCTLLSQQNISKEIEILVKKEKIMIQTKRIFFGVIQHHL